jgi:hypothetical protein
MLRFAHCALTAQRAVRISFATWRPAPQRIAFARGPTKTFRRMFRLTCSSALTQRYPNTLSLALRSQRIFEDARGGAHDNVARPRFSRSSAYRFFSTLFLSEAAAAAEPPKACRIHLLVELTPDVPDPRNVGFLSSLLSNHVSYQLTFNQERDGSIVDLELTGPGPDYRCQNVVKAMRRDGRVLSIYAD